MILGNWAIHDTFKKNSYDYYKYQDERGFEFLKGGVCDYKTGFLDFERYTNDRSKNEKVLYSLGNITKYLLTKDSLKIFNLSNKKWDCFKVKKLNNDTLIINRDTGWATFIKKHYDVKKVPDFDAVVVSSSVCFGACPMLSIMVAKNGTVNYNGLYHVSAKGTYTSKISSDQFKEIAMRFKEADYMNLDKNYFTPVTDSRTCSVLFIKNGKIIKSISDYASSGPHELLWAYLPLINLYQKLDLTPINTPAFTETEFMMADFRVGKSYLELTESETYYLMHSIAKGKAGNFSFKGSYDLHVRNKLIDSVNTNGRYYKFYFKDNTTKTIDIGYNFLTKSNLARTFNKYE